MVRKKKVESAKAARPQRFTEATWLNEVLSQAKILVFGKPAQARSKAEHDGMFVADIPVDGAFVKNVRQGDEGKMFAELVSGTTDHPSIVIKWTLGGMTYVSLTVATKAGFVGKGYVPEVPKGHIFTKATKGKILCVTANGPMLFAEEDFNLLIAAINEAREILKKIVEKQKEMVSA